MNKRLALGLLGLIVVSSASAQQTPIVGMWQTTSMGPPRSVSTVTYAPDGRMLTEMAIAPQPGQNGGVIRSMGQYRLQGPTQVLVRFDQSEMCTAGLPCGPAPQQLAPAPGTQAVLNLQFRGSDQIVGEDGRVWVRIR